MVMAGGDGGGRHSEKGGGGGAMVMRKGRGCFCHIFSRFWHVDMTRHQNTNDVRFYYYRIVVIKKF